MVDNRNNLDLSGANKLLLFLASLQFFQIQQICDAVLRFTHHELCFWKELTLERKKLSTTGNTRLVNTVSMTYILFHFLHIFLETKNGVYKLTYIVKPK